jgi:hypothetical protein
MWKQSWLLRGVEEYTLGYLSPSYSLPEGTKGGNYKDVMEREEETGAWQG